MYRRVWDTATGQCLRTLVHEDNAPVTTVRFSPNGRFILAFTLDSCIRLWDYVAGTCKKTYQGHKNVKYSLGGNFGIIGTQGFIVSGSEDGDIIFWDVKTKEEVQRVQGHEGVVCWVDTSPGSNAIVASGGLDGTVKIWVDVPVDEDAADELNDLKLEPGIAEQDEGNEVDMNDFKVENGRQNGEVGYGNDTPRDDMSMDGDRHSERDHEEFAGGEAVDEMEQD